MSWVAAAIGGASLVSGLLGANAAEDAAHTQADSAAASNAVQLSMFNRTQENLQPWLQAGSGAVKDLVAGTAPGGQFTPQAYQTYTPFTADQFTQDPGYQFQKQEGEAALTNQQSITGGPNSNNMKGLVSFSQGLASTDYQQALQNYINQFQLGNQVIGQNNQNTQQRFANTAAISSGGLTAATGQGNISSNVGANVGGNIVGAGNALAAGTVGASNALTGAGATGYNQYLQQQYLSAFGNKTPGYTPTDYNLSAMGPNGYSPSSE